METKRKLYASPTMTVVEVKGFSVLLPNSPNAELGGYVNGDNVWTD